MLTVPITPNISTKLMLRASLSESLVVTHENCATVCKNRAFLNI